jgi:hypothetical protein
MNSEEEVRFWAKVNKTETCWLWTAFCNKYGYGHFRVDGTTRSAHRLSLELHLGRPLLPGMFVCHAPHSICGHRNCVNPAHLSEKTRAENSADMITDGTSNRGARHPSCKLTEAKVRAIRADTRLLREIATEYGIQVPTVHGIRTRRIWAWLEDVPEVSDS